MKPTANAVRQIAAVAVCVCVLMLSVWLVWEASNSVLEHAEARRLDLVEDGVTLFSVCAYSVRALGAVLGLFAVSKGR